MPNRILRDWTDSEPVNELSVHAERLFVRLIMKVDDWGRLPASPRLLRPLLFPLLLEQVREADLSRWISECETAGLVRLYVVGKKEYVEIKNFRQRTRAPSKYPPPEGVTDTCPSHDGHMTAYAKTKAKAQAKAHSEAKTKAQGDVSCQSARADSSCSSSLAAAPPSSARDDSTSRALAWTKLQLKASALWAPGGSQRASDETDTRNVFDELVWPDTIPPPQCIKRVGTALELVAKAARKQKPMAWWKSELKRRLT